MILEFHTFSHLAADKRNNKFVYELNVFSFTYEENLVVQKVRRDNNISSMETFPYPIQKSLVLKNNPTYTQCPMPLILLVYNSESSIQAWYY